MPLRVYRDPRFDPEFLALPERIRDSCWRVQAALRRRPRSPGAGFRVERLQRMAPTEAWTAHFENDRYRLPYVIDGQTLILFGVGTRPGFYRRLDRLRHPSYGRRRGESAD